MLQGESWTEGASKHVGVGPTRWEAGALGWAIGSEGSEHEDAAGFDRLGGRRHVVIPISWLDQEVEDGSGGPSVIGTAGVPRANVGGGEGHRFRPPSESVANPCQCCLGDVGVTSSQPASRRESTSVEASAPASITEPAGEAQ